MRTAASLSRRGSDTFGDRLRRLEELTGAPDQLAVGVDLTLLAQVADDVPMQRRFVLRATVVEAGAQREVDGAADLLVEQDVPRPAIDLVVEAEGELAEGARPVVGVEKGAEVVGTSAGFGVHDAAALEAEPAVLDLAAVEPGRQREADLALGIGFDRAREDLAVRHVVGAVRRLPAAAGNPEPEVGVRPDDPDLTRVGELGRPRRQLVGRRAPVRDGVFVAGDVASAEDEVLVLSQ